MDSGTESIQQINDSHKCIAVQDRISNIKYYINNHLICIIVYFQTSVMISTTIERCCILNTDITFLFQKCELRYLRGQVVYYDDV